MHPNIQRWVLNDVIQRGGHTIRQLTREQGVRLEQAVGVHWQQFEVLWQNKLAGGRLLGALLPITGQHDRTLVDKRLADALIRHGQGCLGN